MASEHAYDAVPIPTYDEAVNAYSPRPSSRTRRMSSTAGARDRSIRLTTTTPANRLPITHLPRSSSALHDPTSLLYNDPGGRIPTPTRRANYQPPTVEEVVDVEGDVFLGGGGGARDVSGRERRRRRRRRGRRRRSGSLGSVLEDAHGRPSDDLVTSDDDDDDSGSSTYDDSADEEAEVRRELEEMDILEPPSSSTSPRRSLQAWGKRIQDIGLRMRGRMGNAWHFPRIRWNRWDRVDAGDDDDAHDHGIRTSTDDEATAPSRSRFHRLRTCTSPWLRLDANFCILMTRIFAIFLVAGIVWLVFMSDVFDGSRGLEGQMFDPESIRAHLQTMADGNRVRERVARISQTDHMAGTKGGFAVAEYVREVFRSAGLVGVGFDEWDVYLNFPRKDGRSVQILDANGDARWTAQLEEDEAYPRQGRAQPAAFYAYAKDGDARGPLIYANAGTRADFQALADRGIDVKGAIALIRNHGGTADAAIKVKAAELSGVAGCLVYSDPGDDAFGDGKTAPEGRGMPGGGVQRGSMALSNMVLGDPLTPGYASTHGAKRLPIDGNIALVNIPSLPISWHDAQHLLAAIENVGQPCAADWIGAVPSLSYWTGDATSPVVRLVNHQDVAEEQKIYNVIARIPGVEQPSKSVILGARRDSFSFGAVSAASGTAILLEVADLFGDLLQRGWRPLRTIELVSWDGGQYNSLGSTEHVENDIERLRKDSIAYIDLDEAVSGGHFRAAGSPVFEKVLLRALGRVGDPGAQKSLRELWESSNAMLESLDSHGDHAPWQNIAGTSSLNLRFDGGAHPRHSAYDTFEWLDAVGDPGWVHHGLLTQVVSLVLLELADRLVLPLNLSAYSSAANAWVRDLEAWAQGMGAAGTSWDSEPLAAAVRTFAAEAARAELWEGEWDKIVVGNSGFESVALSSHRMSFNTRLAALETHLLDLEDGGGIPNRTQYKHVIFGPRLWSRVEDATLDQHFPGIRDAVEQGDWVTAMRLLHRAADVIAKASKHIIGNG